MRTMNRRTFLHLFTATAAAPVAAALGAGRRDRTCGGTLDPVDSGDQIIQDGGEITLMDDGRPGLSTSGDCILFDEKGAESLTGWPWVRVIVDCREG